MSNIETVPSPSLYPLWWPALILDDALQLNPGAAVDPRDVENECQYVWYLTSDQIEFFADIFKQIEAYYAADWTFINAYVSFTYTIKQGRDGHATRWLAAKVVDPCSVGAIILLNVGNPPVTASVEWIVRQGLLREHICFFGLIVAGLNEKIRFLGGVECAPGDLVRLHTQLVSTLCLLYRFYRDDQTACSDASADDRDDDPDSHAEKHVISEGGAENG